MKALGKALAFVMLLALVGAGTATAAKMITGGQIVNGTVTSADLKDGNVKAKDLSAGAKASLAGQPGPQGPEGPAGQKGDPGAPGSADRYALVRSDGVLQAPKKDIAQIQVSHAGGTGIYCFSFPDDSEPQAGAATGTANDTIATMVIDTDGGITSCPVAATVRVQTWDASANASVARQFRLILEND